MRSDSPSSASNQEQAQLLKALRESELLRELSELLASSLDLTHILQTLVKRTTEVCEVERCAVWLLNTERGLLLPSAYHLAVQNVKSKIVQAADHMWHHSSIPANNPIFDQLQQEHGVLFLEDLRTEPSLRKIAEKFFVRSVLLIALLREGRPVGMMSLDHPGKTCTFSCEQQQLARAIGQQAAIAIDNAHLYQEAQSARSRAERLIQRSQAIYQVALAVNSGTELGEVLQCAVEHLVRGSYAQSAAISLITKDTLSVAATTFFPVPQETSSEVTFAPGITTLPHCASIGRHGTPHFVKVDQFGETEREWFQQLGMENVLIVPLMLGRQGKQIQEKQAFKRITQTKRCAGFIFLNYPYPLPEPGKGKCAFAQDIAAQCALAVEKERILNEARHAVTLATERANTLDAIFNTMTEGILVLDLDGRIITNNNTATRFINTSSNVKKNLATYLKHHPAYTFYGQPMPVEDHPVMRALRGERIRGERFLSRRADEAEDAIEVNIAPLLDSEEQQIGIVCAFRDITEQVRVEQRIRRALDTMLHAAEIVSGLTDIRTIAYRVLAMTMTALNCERGVVQYYNQEAQKFTPLLSIGFSLEEVDQWLAEQVSWLTPEQQHSDTYRQLLEGHATLVQTEGSTERGDFSQIILAAPITHNDRLQGVMLLDRTSPLRKKDVMAGETQPLLPLEFTLWDMAVVEGIAQFAGLAIEQTRWQQEAEIARINEAAMRESNELKDEFLAITAHEFRTPLTVILAHSQMMGRILQKARDVAPDLKTRLDESCSFIEEQARQLTNIVTTFLEVTRLNRGQITLTHEEINLEELVKEAIVLQSATLTNHTIRYRPTKSTLPYLVKGDRARLLQVLINLLQNAVKYSPQGGPITVTLTQRVHEDGTPFVEGCVEDRGIGVPKDAQAHLFERFYRVPGAGGGQIRGVGLGLYVVAEFLRLHDGTIRVESSGIEGEGSRFIFTLPLLQSPQNS